ncbi:hypothetical protein EHO59_09900 [Leptospira semungkisensis]|uniref:Glycosyltransferase RgtA/B/C/D-like domain-containing protein n=1 Tax=Leptospira semungkisensis TaxID=2484985 RepID=A0A4R9FXS4_9LEPT|nr:hypothetical protein [Leptospira semungkisensis]TGK03836.1 hypothetical protein EHO59_09900 [Leptospira semungkisensis]
MIWLWTSIIIFIISLAFSVIGFPKELFWNTEALYLPTILLDVLRDSSPLRGWSFAPTPYFFPDLPAIFVLGYATGDIFKTLVIYAILQVTILALVLGRFIRTLEPKMGRTQSYTLSFLSLSFLFILSEKFSLLYFLYLPSTHISAFITTLWIWPYLRKEKVPKNSVFPILSLITLSDRILVFELYFAAALCWARRYGRWGISFPLISLKFFFAGAVGIALNMVLRVLLTIQSPNKIPITDSILLWWKDLVGSLLQLGLPGIFLVCSFITALWCLKKSKEWGHSLGFIGYFQLILVLLPPLTGIYTGENGLKISLPAFVMVPVLFGVLLSLRNPGDRSNSRNFAILGLIIGLGIFTGYRRQSEGNWAPISFSRPDEVSCVDDWKEKDSFVLVLAEARKAKRIFIYSETKTLAYPIDFSTLEGAHTLSNKEWFLFPPEGPIAVLPDGLGEHRIKSFYGEPTRILDCPNGLGKILVYEETQKIIELLQRPFQKTK